MLVIVGEGERLCEHLGVASVCAARLEPPNEVAKLLGGLLLKHAAALKQEWLLCMGV